MIKNYSLYFILTVGGNLFYHVEAKMMKRDVDDNGYRPPPPAILSHKQAVTNDGVFNYVFAADNGLKQGESISPDGTRTGAYQYIDPSGQTISVKYTAGKDGFRIIEGDHIPLQPQPVKPIPEYQPPEYREKLEEKSGNQKYKASIKHYNNYQEENQRQDEPRYVQEQPARYREEEPKYRQQEQPRYQQDKQHRYQAERYQPNSQKNLFRPAQSEGQQRGFQKNQQQQNLQRARSMLYDVEQRHDVNYRKYLDNGQAADSNGQSENQASEPAHHFGGGYNFEFKG